MHYKPMSAMFMLVMPFSFVKTYGSRRVTTIGVKAEDLIRKLPIRLSVDENRRQAQPVCVVRRIVRRRHITGPVCNNVCVRPVRVVLEPGRGKVPLGVDGRVTSVVRVGNEIVLAEGIGRVEHVEHRDEVKRGHLWWRG